MLVMSLFFNLQFYLIAVPLTFVIVPYAITYTFFHIWRERKDANSISTYLKRSASVYLLGTIYGFLYFATKFWIDLYDKQSAIYAIGAINQVLIYTFMPFLPLGIHHILYRKQKVSADVRIAESYFIFAICALMLLVQTYQKSPILYQLTAHDPLMPARLTNIQGVFSLVSLFF